MRSPIRPRRSGTTLMEVLIAIFIMALGLMALLTLFPLGLLQMAAAIKDDQCARGAANAEATMRTTWKQMWEDVPPVGSIANNNQPPLDTANITSLLSLHGRVFVDPIGMIGNPAGSQQQLLLGGYRFPPPAVPGQWQGQSSMLVGTPRSSMAIWSGSGAFLLGRESNPYAVTRRYCSLLDDITFDNLGQPDNNNLPVTSPGSVRRVGRYNYAWLLTRRPGQPPYEANLTVVMYGGLKGARSMDLPSTETAYPAIFLAGQTAAYLQYGGTTPGVPQDKPKLSRNSWVYDNANGYFYRVVDVNEDQTINVFPNLPNDGSTTVILELQTPAIANAFSTSPATPSFATGAGVVMELIAEVFDKGTISPFAVPELQP